MSFGVGDDQGYIYSATARPATDEEAAPAIEKRNQDRDRRAKKEELARIGNEIRKTGVSPQERQDWPDGDVIGNLLSTAFIIGSDKIWVITYNGRDGDDWSWNNIGQSIGTYVPYTKELAEKIRLNAAG